MHKQSYELFREFLCIFRLIISRFSNDNCHCLKIHNKFTHHSMPSNSSFDPSLSDASSIRHVSLNQLFEHLEISDLRIILFNFLLATTAKDVSVFLSITPLCESSRFAALLDTYRNVQSFRHINVKEEPQNRPENIPIHIQHLPEISNLDKFKKIHRVCFMSDSFSENPASLDCDIQISVIDFDAKPVTKLSRYFKMDGDIVNHFLNKLF